MRRRGCIRLSERWSQSQLSEGEALPQEQIHCNLELKLLRDGKEKEIKESSASRIACKGFLKTLLKQPYFPQLVSPGLCKTFCLSGVNGLGRLRPCFGNGLNNRTAPTHIVFRRDVVYLTLGSNWNQKAVTFKMALMYAAALISQHTPQQKLFSNICNIPSERSTAYHCILPELASCCKNGLNWLSGS